MRTIHVPGDRETSQQESIVKAEYSDIVKGRVKEAVRLDRGRAALPHLVVTDVADDDVVEIELDGGLKRWIRGSDLESELGAERKRAGDVVQIPSTLPRRGQQRGVGAWVLTALRVFGVDLAQASALEIARRLEERAVSKPGLRRWGADGVLAPVANEISGDGKLLLFLHGTGSSTRGGFGALRDPTRQRQWNDLRQQYGDRIFALEHKTLTESPIQNAIQALEKLPANATLHLVSHSRGGLVGELLCRAFLDGRDEPFTREEIGLLKFAPQRDQLGRLGELLKQKKPRVERFVRVASPSRGTILASERLDRYLTVLVNVLGYIPALKVPPYSEIYDFLKAFLLAVVKERTRPESIPGLEAMMPESPFQKILNRPDVKADADLAVIKGDLEGQGLFDLATLKAFATDLFYREDHDLVVNTAAMDGGMPRKNGARTFFDRGPKVDHFSYFRNGRTAEQLVKALKGSLDDFALISPTPVARALAVSRGGPRPTVFVVPGFAGSLLTARGQAVWVKSDQLVSGALGRIAIDQPDVAAEGLVDLQYGELMQALSVSHHVVPFPFDWRRSLLQEGQRFGEALDRHLSTNTKQPVRIVAHSMGGLLVRAAFAQNAGLWERFSERDESRIALLGVPHGGTYAVPLMLMGRDQTSQMLSALDFTLDHARQLAILAAFPGLLEMMPRDGASFDLFTTSSWSTLQASDPLGIPWQLPSEDALKAAEQARSKIDGAPFDPERMLYVAGQNITVDGIRTETRERQPGEESPQGGNDGKVTAVVFTRTQEGDGRVTWKSGILPRMRAWYSQAAHGDLAQDVQTIAATIDLLQRGTTSRLPTIPPSTGNLETKAIEKERMEVFPDDAVLTAAAIGARITRPAVARPDLIRIAVGHGNLAFARHPIMVGHYRGDTFAGAELHLDRMLGRRLEARRRLGLYPDAIGTTELILDATDDTRGAIVVGLGDAGRLTQGELTRTLTRGLLRYAAYWLEHRRAHQSVDAAKVSVSTLLIGSGEGGLPPSICVTALMEALHRAQRTLATMNTGFEEIEIVELYEDRAVQIWHAVQEFSMTNRGDFIANERELRQGEGGRRRVAVEDDRSWYQPINISMEKPGAADERMQFIVPTGMARTEAAVLPAHKEFVDRFIEQAIAGRSDDPTHGSPGRALFELLVPEHLKERTRDDRPLRLILDPACAAYPWELMDDRRPWDDDGAQAAKDMLPPALRAGMIRQLVGRSFRQRIVRPEHGKALVIGDPRGDRTGHFNPLPAAIDEANMVAELLASEGRFEVSSLIGEKVTADQVVMQLCAQDWRIIHFATHGVLEGQGDVKATGIVLGRKMILTADMLRQLLPFSPDLMFVNCCYLGTIDPNPARRRPDKFAGSVAAGLIEMGAGAVVAAGWAVDDQPAQNFAVEFYRAVLNCTGFGDAVLAARQSTFRAYPTSTTWGAYQCYGEPDWRLFFPRGSGGRWQPRFASWVELENEVDRVRQDAQTGMARDLAREISYLEDLKKEADKRSWADNPELLASFGAAYGELGQLEVAHKYYEKAIRSERGKSSLETIEQFANLRLREAMQQRPRVPAECKRIAGEALEQLKSLASLAGNTVERFGLQGGCHKRIAQVTTGVERKNALQLMAEAYKNADDLARQNGRVDPYPILMRVAARLASDWRARPQKALVDELQPLIDIAREAAVEADRVNPTFWSCIAAADAQMLQFLLDGEIDANKRRTLEETYLKHWNRGGSWLKFRSVLEQFDFYLDVWRDEAEERSEPKRTALREEIAKLRNTLDNRVQQAEPEGAPQNMT